LIDRSEKHLNRGRAFLQQALSEGQAFSREGRVEFFFLPLEMFCSDSVDKTFGHEAMYVALSRARYEAKIITPDKDEMLATISQSRAKLSALDVTSEGISLAQANSRKKL
jgi:hypothetical protein